MSVIIVPRYERRTVQVYIYRDAGRHGEHLRLDDENWSWDPIPDGTAPDVPTFELPERIFEELMREGGKVVQANDQTIEALADTRAVRDRLLALVESGWIRG